VSARELTFWRAFEQVEGPIGYGPLVKLAAWLGWTQCDGKKVSPADVLQVVEGFLVDPLDDETADETADDEEVQAARRAAVEAKLMAIFKHPKLEERRHDDR
jgi:hypothetical protein